MTLIALRPVLVVLLGSACAPEATIELIAPLQVDVDNFCVSAGPRESPLLFDLEAAAGFILPIDFTIDVTGDDVRYGILQAETVAFFTGALPADPTLPTSAATARRRAQGTDFASEGGSVSAFFVEVTDADVAALTNEPVASSLRTPIDRLPLQWLIDVDAVVAPLDGGGFVTAASAGEIVVPIDLCLGCLVPDCEGELIDAGCFRGVDLPSVCSAE